MSKPFEITEQKHEPGNNPSLMHHEAQAKSLHSAFPYTFVAKALWRFILHQAQGSAHTPTTCWDNLESAGQESVRLWSLLMDSAAYRSSQKKKKVLFQRLEESQKSQSRRNNLWQNKAEGNRRGGGEEESR